MEKGLIGRGARELADLIRHREVSSAEVVEAHIGRIQEVNPRLNALVVPLFDQARSEAKLADEALARQEAVGPLHGVPITIKECHHVAGTCSCAGVDGLKGHRAAADSLMVARLRQAGAVVLGKSNVPQLMMFLEADNPVYGRTNNPWNPDRSPGGSSGGEAALIASGASPLGLGSDIGGSIRVPSHFSGICGLKPTSGRLSIEGSADQVIMPGQEAILDQPGPMARRVEDLALAMSVLAAPGQELLDPTIAPVPWRDPAEVSLQGLRIGLVAFDGFLPASPAIRRAVAEAGAALEALGARVEPFTPPAVGEAVHLYTAIMSADGGAWAREVLRGSRVDRRIGSLVRLARLPSRFWRLLAGPVAGVGQAHLGALLRAMGARPAKGYWDLVLAKNQYRTQFLAAMDAQRLDALICPPFLTPALTHGASEFLNPVAAYAQLYNLLGLPAGVAAATRVRPGEESDRAPSRSLPEQVAARVEQGSAGLPVGVQVAGRPWREDVVLAVMGALEGHFRAQPDYPTLV
ncbi:MAG TPA: amidase [Symbiobacteriaceae bacterium]|nr:amidase [Symbiobacteriaceae bacterium]